MSELLDAFLETMRVVACVTGLLVVVDSVGILLSWPERPPHRPRANAAAWLIVAGTSAIVAGYLVGGKFGWVGDADPPSAKFAAALLWVGLSAGFTARAITRAERPRLIVASAVMMSAFGTVLALVSRAA